MEQSDGVVEIEVPGVVGRQLRRCIRAQFGTDNLYLITAIPESADDVIARPGSRIVGMAAVNHLRRMSGEPFNLSVPAVLAPRLPS